MCNHHRACCVSIVAILLALGVDFGSSFSSPVFVKRQSLSDTKLAMFGNLKDAFKNDDTLGKADNPGLKNASY
jgi:hypothetical protein